MSKNRDCKMCDISDDLMKQNINEVAIHKLPIRYVKDYSLLINADDLGSQSIKIVCVDQERFERIYTLDLQEVCDYFVESSVLKQEYKKFHLRVLADHVELWATPKTIAEKKKHYTAKITKDLAREIDDVQAVYAYGKQKYPQDKWRKQDTRVHIQHAIDHLISYSLGTKYDESHISNLAHAACRILFALHIAEDDFDYIHWSIEEGRKEPISIKACEQCSCYRRNTCLCHRTKQPVYMPFDGTVCSDFSYSDAYTAFVDDEFQEKGFDKEKLGMLKRAMKAREVMKV